MGIRVGVVGRFKLCKLRQLCVHGEAAAWAGPLLALQSEKASLCTAVRVDERDSASGVGLRGE